MADFSVSIKFLGAVIKIELESVHAFQNFSDKCNLPFFRFGYITESL